MTICCLSIVVLASSVSAQRIAVAAIDIPRGKTLTDRDVRWITESHPSDSTPTQAMGTRNSDNTQASNNNAPIGWIARKAIKKGEKLEIPTIAKPDVILTGDKVRAVYKSDDVTISVDGIAINRGAVGDTVFIRLQNRKRVRGRIESDATISIL